MCERSLKYEFSQHANISSVALPRLTGHFRRWRMKDIISQAGSLSTCWCLFVGITAEHTAEQDRSNPGGSVMAGLCSLKACWSSRGF